jgi:hypothetical protein
VEYHGYGSDTVEASAWVKIEDRCRVRYWVYPESDAIELTLGSNEELSLHASEGGLRHCIAAFTSALEAFEAAAAQPDDTGDEHVFAGDPPAGGAG